MITILIQTFVAAASIAAFILLKALALPGWVTYPVLVLLIVMSLLGLAAAHKFDPASGSSAVREFSKRH